MSYAARGVIWIPLRDWAEFVQSYAPKDGSGEMFSFGPPEIKDGAVEIPYAANTECHPCEEADPPEWEKVND